MKKRLSVLAVAGTIGLVGLGSAGASALSSASSPNESVVNRLVEKFNLDKADVQAVFDEEHDARQAERRAAMSERLQAAVDDGDITAEQKALIEKKREELHEAREKQHAELEQWAEDNDIDTKYLMGGGMKGGHGMGRGF